MGAQTKDERLLAEVPAALAGLLDVPIGEVTARTDDASGAHPVLSAAGQTFVVEWSGSPTAGPVAARAVKAAQRAKGRDRRAIPLVAVPFMSEAGRRACEAARVPWFDLSGNAHIVAPGLRIIVEGRPNRFRGPGRPASLFAPKSARVVRWLLMHPDRAFTQREIARSTAMTEGFVSRIVARLEADSYLVRVGVSGEGDGFGGGYGYGSGAGAGAGDGSGGSHQGKAPVRVRDASLLLDAWREEYQFSKHNIIRGHVSARSGDALARFVSDTLVHDKVEHAATGLAAAWQLTHFAAFRIATFFVTREPAAELKAKLGFRDDARGANLWLVVPNDAGVFHGAEDREGLRCVHPVQAYLDLKGHPERAAEAAERLRTEFMNWKRDA
jgi:hypothetical protein